MICYFREDLKPSIKVEMEQQDRESINFEEIVQKTVNAKAKTGPKSSTMVQNSDIRFCRSHRPFNSTGSKVQTQGTTAKDSNLEEPKVKEAKPTLPRAEASKPSKQGARKRKRRGTRKSENKSQPQLAPPTQRRFRRKKRRIKIEISVRSCVSTVIRRAIMPIPIPNLKKTDVSLSSLCTSDWWWQGGRQGTLHLLSNLIQGRPSIGKGLA